MTKVIGVSFKKGGRIYNFLPNKLELVLDEPVIVETERGTQFGYVSSDLIDLDDKKIKSPLKQILRKASEKDLEKQQKNEKDAGQALLKARELVKKMDLNMNLIDASYTFDKEQLMYHFLADNRVDFRELAKSLASIYHTRIELRQVGVRDKAREIGGIGMCGKELCCCQYNYDFDAVSINMAKNQNLSLNPSKINGICGRLLCCLKYEDECYCECKSHLPIIGKIVDTEKGKGKVVSLDILRQKYTVDVENVGLIEVKIESNK